jgi:hypothetical protein
MILSVVGEIINIDKVFNVEIYTDINFGADKRVYFSQKYITNRK